MRLSSVSFLLALILPAGMARAQVALPVGSSHFTILQQGKTVGSAEFTIGSIAGGYTITSHGDLRLTKLTYSFNNSQNLDRMLNLVGDDITGQVNGSPVTFSVKADPTGRKFNISVTAQGKTTQNTIDRHQHLALLPDLDAAGYMLLNRIGLENPQISWALIPKQNGLLVPTTYKRDPNARGRLDGREMEIEHTTATMSAQNAISVELFYASDGRLLEADLPEQNFYVVRDGFKLTNRPKYVPPRNQEGSGPPPQGASQPQVQQ